MSKIHLLDNTLIDKIAAGEVVERPASVVKELLENSIDAGATALTVEIRDGGTSYIRVSDNGKGIPRDEIRTAFMRHATSKLETFEDLDGILTLGFRGEALSSIASVADVEMVTRTAEDSEGTRIELSGGRVVDELPAAAEVGTIFTVKNLFYNTPARRKFLKKPATESGYVADVVNRIALGHPHIAIKYINNGNVMLQTSGNNDLRTTAFHIYGKENSLKLIEAELSKDGYSIKGLVGKPELSRANRTYENFFINGRYVKSAVVSSAVEEAYKGRLMTGKFPVFILNMTVPKSTVDVNVHPTKLEVRFSDDDFIYSLVYDAVDKALKGGEFIPRVEWSKTEKKPEPVQTKLDTDRPKNIYRLAEDYGKGSEASFSSIVQKVYEDKGASGSDADSLRPSPGTLPEVTTPENKPKSVTEKVMEPAVERAPENIPRHKFFTHYRIVGQVFNTYWIVEQDDKMYMIDQHAAHERVLYEELTNKMRTGSNVSQILLQPIAVNLTEAEKEIVEENRQLLESFGYDIEELGPKACALRAVPFVFDEPSNAAFFLDIIDTLKDKSLKSIYDTKLDAIATMSCKAAVKGNDKLSFTEAKTLIERMLELENPFNCPHGRPTVIEMTRYELEKKFKRIV